MPWTPESTSERPGRPRIGRAIQNESHPSGGHRSQRAAAGSMRRSTLPVRRTFRRSCGASDADRCVGGVQPALTARRDRYRVDGAVSAEDHDVLALDAFGVISWAALDRCIRWELQKPAVARTAVSWRRATAAGAPSREAAASAEATCCLLSLVRRSAQKAPERPTRPFRMSGPRGATLAARHSV